MKLWRPRYLCLKNGRLYWFSNSELLPVRVSDDPSACQQHRLTGPLRLGAVDGASRLLQRLEILRHPPHSRAEAAVRV